MYDLLQNYCCGRPTWQRQHGGLVCIHCGVFVSWWVATAAIAEGWLFPIGGQQIEKQQRPASLVGSLSYVLFGLAALGRLIFPSPPSVTASIIFGGGFLFLGIFGVASLWLPTSPPPTHISPPSGLISVFVLLAITGLNAPPIWFATIGGLLAVSLLLAFFVFRTTH